MSAILADAVLAARIGWRDLKRGARGLIVVVLALALGVAAIAGVGSVNRSVLDALQRDARSLFGGDIAFESGSGPVDTDTVRSLLPEGSVWSRGLRTTSLAASPSGRRVAITLQGVDRAYPLLGAVELDPPLPLRDALAGGGVAVEPALLARLGIAVGDRIRIGDAAYTVRAAIVRQPDQTGGFGLLGPRVLADIDALGPSGILAPGSLVRYRTQAVLPEGVEPSAFAARVEAAHPDAAWRLRAFDDDRPRLERTTERLGTYLTFAALTTLLVSSVGLSLAASSHLQSRTQTIAVLKSLGTASRVIGLAFVFQILALAGLGVLIGLIGASGLVELPRLVPATLLPAGLDLRLHAGAALLASVFGLVTAFLVSVLPLGRAALVPAATLFRSEAGAIGTRTGPRVRFVALALGLLLAVLAVLAVPSRGLGLAFVSTALGGGLLLAVTARIAVRSLALLGRRAPGRVRLAFANLGRPGSSSAMVAAALGSGLAVLGALVLIERNLFAELESGLPDRAPSLFVIDIPQDAQETFRTTVAQTEGAQIVQEAPLLRARVTRIAGTPVDEVALDPEVAWTVRRDRGLTFAARPPAGTELVAGRWWPADYAGPPLVSVHADIAAGYGVGIGDRLTFNILGRPIEAEIASLRREQWEDAGLEFVFVLSPGLLEAAPHTLVATLDVPVAGEAALLDVLADRVPGATPISVREIVESARSLLERAAFAVRLIGGVTVLGGLLALVAAVSAARRRHRRDALVLRLLGAGRGDLLRIFFAEYAGLGAAAALTGAVIATVAAFIVVVGIMDLSWSFDAAALLQVLALGLALVIGTGAVGTWDLSRRPPARDLASGANP